MRVVHTLILITTNGKAQAHGLIVSVTKKKSKLVALVLGDHQEFPANVKTKRVYNWRGTYVFISIYGESMSNELIKLQKWYAAQCQSIESVPSGQTPWQDKYGISIGTSDNPAWNVTIDLAGTSLEGTTIPAYNIDNGDEDWVRCHIIDNHYYGIGDPSKLIVILNYFFQFQQDH